MAQKAEQAELDQQLKHEQKVLAESQTKNVQQLAMQHQKEDKELEQRIALRRKLLDQKVFIYV